MEEVAVKPRDVMPEGARTLPARYYTDPALLQAELDRTRSLAGVRLAEARLARAVGR